MRKRVFHSGGEGVTSQWRHKSRHGKEGSKTPSPKEIEEKERPRGDRERKRRFSYVVPRIEVRSGIYCGIFATQCVPRYIPDTGASGAQSVAREKTSYLRR